MLPAEKKESVIDKIINFFKGLFRGKNETQTTTHLPVSWRTSR